MFFFVNSVSSQYSETPLLRIKPLNQRRQLLQLNLFGNFQIKLLNPKVNELILDHFYFQISGRQHLEQMFTNCCYRDALCIGTVTRHRNLKVKKAMLQFIFIQIYFLVKIKFNCKRSFLRCKVIFCNIKKLLF